MSTIGNTQGSAACRCTGSHPFRCAFAVILVILLLAACAETPQDGPGGPAALEPVSPAGEPASESSGDAEAPPEGVEDAQEPAAATEPAEAPSARQASAAAKSAGQAAAAEAAYSNYAAQTIEAIETAESLYAAETVYTAGMTQKTELRTVDAAQFGKLLHASKMDTLLVFWAPWCKPCLEEIPEIVDFYYSIRGQDIRILSVAVMTELEDSLKPFLAENPVPYPVYYLEATPEELLEQLGFETVWTGSLPATFVLAGDGTVLREWFDKVDRAELASAFGVQ